MPLHQYHDVVFYFRYANIDHPLFTAMLWFSRPPCFGTVVSSIDGEPACLCSHSLNELDFGVHRTQIWAQAPGVKTPVHTGPLKPETIQPGVMTPKR